MAEINWKSKYTELKSKYMSAVDAAFRIGMEQGIQQAQVQQAQDQAAQQQAQEQAEAQGQGQPGQEGQEGQPGQPGEEQPQDSSNPQGSELDQHISTLEGMLSKSMFDENDIETLKKSIKDLKFGIEMKKSDAAVISIGKSLKKTASAPVSFNISKTADANLNPTAKAALAGQQKIVANIMDAWGKQESDLSKSISQIVAGEGLKKD